MSLPMIKKIVPRTISLCLLLTALLGLLNETDSIDTNWSLTFIPLFISFALILPFSHMYVSEAFSQLKPNSLLMILIILHFVTTSLFIFTVLLSLKLDDVISISWLIVFVPVWFAVFAMSFFMVFMLPGMLDPSVKLQREAWSLLSISIALIASSIMLPVYLNDDLEDLWIALLPIILVLPAGFAFYLRFEIEKMGVLGVLVDIELVLYVIAIVLVFLAVGNDENGSVSDYSFFIVLIIGCCWQAIANELRKEDKQEQDSETLILTGHDID